MKFQIIISLLILINLSQQNEQKPQSESLSIMKSVPEAKSAKTDQRPAQDLRK